MLRIYGGLLFKYLVYGAVLNIIFNWMIWLVNLHINDVTNNNVVIGLKRSVGYVILFCVATIQCSQ